MTNKFQKNWHTLLDADFVIDDSRLLELQEAAKLDLFRRMSIPLVPCKVPTPEGTACTECGSISLELLRAPIGGPWSGMLTCLDCGNKQSVCSHLGKTCISVESLPVKQP